MLSLPLLLSACHDEEQTVVEAPADILSHFNAEGKAWLTLDLSLSDGDGTTRATTFDDGTSAEHAIRTLTLVLFHGTDTEDQMQVASTYLVDYAAEADGHAQVTHHSQNTIQISSDNINANDRLAILAIANASPAISAGQTFADVRDLTADIITTISGTDYYVMSSSPLASANDGTGTVSTLVGITSDNLHPTEAEARSNPAGHIYLERAAAKVTVTESVNPKEILGNPNITFTSGDIKFALYNYNDQCRLVRLFNTAWLTYNDTKKRFVEQVPLPSGKYRTYWAEDKNYTSRSGLRTIKGWNAVDQHYYCAENTFSTAAMTDENTTSVVVRIRLNNGGDFYTASTTGRDIVYLPPVNTVAEEGTGASSSFSRLSGLSNSITSQPFTHAKTIDEYLREWLWQTNDDFRTWVNTYAAGDANHVNIAVYKDTSEKGSGKADAQVTAVTQTARTSGTGVTAFATLDLVNYINSNIKIDYYWRGYTYYRVPIRHFDDTQTPWTSTAAMTDNSTSQVYAANDADYLGRYGMVRNNWYTISINSVTHVGSPVIPTLTTDADDRVEQLLNATLNITGWNEHNQSLTP